MAGPKKIPEYSYFAYESEVTDFIFQSTESSLESARMSSQKDARDHLYMSYMGERIRSIRTLIRRSMWTSTLKPAGPTEDANNNANFSLRSVLSRYPLQYGNAPDAVHDTAAAGTFNYTAVNPLSYIAPCFVGQRGGVNLHVNAMSQGAAEMVSIKRSATARTKANFNAYGANLTTSVEYLNDNILDHDAYLDLAGGSLTNLRTVSGVQSHIPFYSRFKFDDTDPSKMRVGSSELETTTDSVQVSMRGAGIGTTCNNTRLQINYGAGIDYNLFFYLNVPTLYTAANPAPALS